MSDQPVEITPEEIAQGKRTVPSLAATLHKLVDRVFSNPGHENELAHESIDQEFPQDVAQPATPDAPPAPPEDVVDPRDAEIADLKAQLQAAQGGQQ